MENNEELIDLPSETEDFALDLEEAKAAIEEEAVEENKDIVIISEEEVLLFKNLNLQMLLADKSIENLQLKQSLLVYEKQAVAEKVKDLKVNIQTHNNISLEDYAIDLPNKRLVHKNLLPRK